MKEVVTVWNKEEIFNKFSKIIDKLSFSDAEHMYNNLEKLHKEKIRIFQAMIDEAKDIEKLDKIRLEKDEQKLLSQLRHEGKKEYRYQRFANSRLGPYFEELIGTYEELIKNTFFNDAPLNESGGTKEDLRKDMRSIASMFSDSISKLVEVNKEQLKFLNKWRGGFFHFLKKKNVLDEFKTHASQMLNLIEKENEYVAFYMPQIERSLDNIERWKKELKNSSSYTLKGKSAEFEYTILEKFTKAIKPFLNYLKFEPSIYVGISHSSGSKSGSDDSGSSRSSSSEGDSGEGSFGGGGGGSGGGGGASGSW